METDIESAQVPEQASSCAVCGRQDATLRAVSYPYSVSLIVVTFRRAFSGVWCRRHRRRYLLLASLITASIGWFGIPFGFVYTPIFLFILAKGGIQQAALNFKLLVDLAERKLLSGDRPGAIACLEQSLQFGDSPDVRQKLSTLYLQEHREVSTGTLASAGKFFAMLALLLACALIGSAIGLFDVILIQFLGPLFSSSGSILSVILSWIPLSLMLFFGILAIQYLTGWSLRRIGSASQAFSMTLAIFATLFACYAILEGRSLAYYAYHPLQSYFLSSRDALFAARALLAYGGVLEFINNLRLNATPGLIYNILLCAAVACSLLAGTYAAKQSSRWQGLLAQVRPASLSGEDRPSSAPWASLIGILAVVVLATFVLSPGRFRNVEEAYLHFYDGFSAVDNNDDSKAFTEFNQMVKIWPESALGHTSLATVYAGREKLDTALSEAQAAFAQDPRSLYVNYIMALIHLRRSEFTQAVESFQQVQAAQPSLGFPHAYLAALYYVLDKEELADQEAQLALDREEGDVDASRILSAYFSGRRDYEMAEMHLSKALQASPDASTYLELADIYASQGKFDPARKAIEKAKELGADQFDLHMAWVDLFEFRGNYQDAASEIASALLLKPGSSDAHVESSYIDFKLGKINDAALEAEKALAINPYNFRAYIEQAFAYQAQGKLDQALAAAENGIALSPKSDRAHYILGLVYMQKNRKPEAIREFEAFLDLYWERPFPDQLKAKAEQYLDQLR